MTKKYPFWSDLLLKREAVTYKNLKFSQSLLRQPGQVSIKYERFGLFFRALA